MLLKRKRSELELSHGSVFSPAQPSHSFNFDAMSAMETARRGFFAPRLSTPHLPGRTRKRFRDNRPSDSVIYQHTLDLLYSAQHRPHEAPHAQPHSPKIDEGAASSLQTPTRRYHGGQQRSLHSFWNLPRSAASPNASGQSPVSSVASSPARTLTPRNASTICEDCGAGLGASEDDVMTDADGYGMVPEDHTCGACGKAVCFSCSISNLGEHRRCLRCAGPTPPGWQKPMDARGSCKLMGS